MNVFLTLIISLVSAIVIISCLDMFAQLLHHEA